MLNQGNLLQIMKANIKASKPFPTVLVGIRPLVRSAIPLASVKSFRFDLDIETFNIINQIASANGLTSDEFVRQALWTAVSL